MARSVTTIAARSVVAVVLCMEFTAGCASPNGSIADSHRDGSDGPASSAQVGAGTSATRTAARAAQATAATSVAVAKGDVGPPPPGSDPRCNLLSAAEIRSALPASLPALKHNDGSTPDPHWSCIGVDGSSTVYYGTSKHATSSDAEGVCKKVSTMQPVGDVSRTFIPLQGIGDGAQLAVEDDRSVQNRSHGIGGCAWSGGREFFVSIATRLETHINGAAVTQLLRNIVGRAGQSPNTR